MVYNLISYTFPMDYEYTDIQFGIHYPAQFGEHLFSCKQLSFERKPTNNHACILKIVNLQISLIDLVVIFNRFCF